MSIDPIKYADIGKGALDILTKDYPSNILKLEINGTEATSYNSNSKLSVNLSNDMKTNALAGDLQNTLTMAFENPFVEKSQALIVESQTKITSQGNIEGSIELKDPYIKGLSANVTGVLLKDGCSIQPKMGFTYANAIACRTFLHSNISIDISNGSTVSKSTALKYREFAIGSFISFDTIKGNIDNHSYVVGVDYPRYKASFHALNGGSSFMATLYQKFTSGVEAGCKYTFKKPTSDYLLEFGCKVPFDKQSFAKAKMDHTGKAALSYTSRLSERVSMTLAAAFDSLAPNDLNSRKLGCSILVDM